MIKVYILAKDRKNYKKAIRDNELKKRECRFVTSSTDLLTMDPETQRYLLYREYYENVRYNTQRFQYIFGYVVENANMLPLDTDDEFNKELRNGADIEKLAEMTTRGSKGLLEEMQDLVE